MSGERGVVVYGRGKRCDRVGRIDLTSGKLAQLARVPAPKDTLGGPHGETKVAVAGEIVVFDERGATTAYGLAGRQLWRLEDAGKCTHELFGLSERRVVLDKSCVVSDKRSILTLEATTGRPAGETEFPKRTLLHHVVSVDPLVAVLALDTRAADLTTVVFDDQGRRTIEIPARVDGRELRTHGEGLLSAAGIVRPVMAVRGNTLYAVDKGMTPWHLVAYDLTTGKNVWTEQGNLGDARIIRVDDEGVLAMEENERTLEVGLVRIDLESGRNEAVLTGELTTQWPSMRASVVYEHDGMLVLSNLSRKLDIGSSLTVLR